MMTDGRRDADVVEVDQSQTRPVAQLRALADEGLFGLAGPVEAGGSDCDLATSCEVVRSSPQRV